MSYGATLAAFYFDGRESLWLKHVLGIVNSQGYSTDSASALIWRPELRSTAGSVTYADGWSLNRLWVGGQRPALSIVPHRIYFDSSGQIDSRPERVICGDRRPNTPLKPRIEALNVLVSHLSQNASVSQLERIVLQDYQVDLGNTCQRIIGNHHISSMAKFSSTQNSWGFDEIPVHSQVLIVPTDTRFHSASEDYLVWAQKYSDNRIKFRVISLEKLCRRLEELVPGEISRKVPSVVMLMLGVRRADVSEEIRSLMRRLDQLSIPWRRAYSDDDRKWSVRDQLGSLVQGLGGRTFRIADAQIGQLPWSLGIDLSHKRGSANSVLCGALIEPDGSLHSAWVHRHSRDEQISKVALRRIMLEAATVVKGEASQPGMLVIRDGRLFEREDQQFYRERLGIPITLLELRKRKNPPLLIDGDLSASPSCAYMPEMPDGDQLAFVVTLPRRDRGAFDSVLKMHWKDSWDGLGVGNLLPNIIVALSRTPGLGLHPRYLPAPIYWADGIAGATDEDLRFRGQAVIELN